MVGYFFINMEFMLMKDDLNKRVLPKRTLLRFGGGSDDRFNG